MSKVTQAGSSRIMGLAAQVNFAAGLTIVLVYGAAVFYAYNAIENDIRKNTIEKADRWYNAALAGNDKVERLLSGQILSQLDETRLAVANEVANVDIYKLRNREGFVSRSNAGTLMLGDDAVARMDRALQAMRERRTLVGTYDLLETHLKDHITVYMPVMRPRGPIAVIQLEMNKGAATAAAHQQFLTVLLLTSIIAAFSLFGVVVTGVLLRRQKVSSAHIRHLAHHDPLTGVANRAQFLETLERELARARKNGAIVAVQMIDLDRFKSINDLLGHDTGDALIQEAAKRISGALREGDLTARLGGDEFAIIQVFRTTKPSASATARRVVAAIRAIREVNGTPVNVTASIGVVTSAFTRDVKDIQRLADAALYEAKESGRDRYVIYKDGMEEAVRQRTTMRAMIRECLRNETFDLFYQPLHDAAEGRLVGFEALLRMPDGEGGYVSPAVFVPIAEEIGVTPALGEWVLRAATEAAASWPGALRVSVNLSPQQFQVDVVDVVRSALAASGLAPERLELEITENLFISDVDHVERELHRLKALGVRIVMDDFGTGYSSLQHLWKFPFDKLKVDRSCLMSLDENDSVKEVLRTITAMSGSMNLRVTAEGVETQRQADFAREAGYDEVQGFLYSRPMPVNEVAGYIRGFGHGREQLDNTIPFPRRTEVSDANKRQRTRAIAPPQAGDVTNIRH
ncbi:MAG: EAL domain-containing protein [Pseudomonadota bacterium]